MSLLKPRRSKKNCLIAECGGEVSSFGYCQKHYRQRKNTGRLCSIPECGEPYECSGYCQNHYYRWRTHGDPHFVKCLHGKGHTKEEKFWSRVDKSPGLGIGDCWEWQGKKIKFGYAHTRFQGKNLLVHRVSWALTFGELPKMNLLHRCDNPACVNPSHLREGTLQENTQDMLDRQRQSRGEHRPTAKLTEADVITIRTAPKVWGFQTKLAKRFGLNTATISRIRRGITWKHV